VVKGEPQSYKQDCLQLRVATVAESNFRVARKNDGEKTGIQLWRVKAHEPEILRGEYIPISDRVKAFLTEFCIKVQIIKWTEDAEKSRVFFNQRSDRLFVGRCGEC
jgi:hypothetical protein